MFYLVIYWTQKVHNDFSFLCGIVLSPVGHSSNHGYHCWKLQDIRALVRIFIALLRFSFGSPPYLRKPMLHLAVHSCSSAEAGRSGNATVTLHITSSLLTACFERKEQWMRTGQKEVKITQAYTTNETSSLNFQRHDRLCGLVVRVSGYRYRGLGFDSQRHQIFWVAVGLERGALSLVSLVRSIEELLE